MTTVHIILLLSLQVSHLFATDTHVYTDLGEIQGTQDDVQGALVNTFLGVPFGKPPLANRFAPASPVDAWDGTLYAYKPAAACYQETDKMFPNFPGTEMWNAGNISEDCLYLNIWARYDAYNSSVMVWIFGGGFFSGSPSLPLYDGATLASKGEVVVVNLNYRVGPFGFLYLNDSLAPGNVGLLDQRLALLWIYDHIEKFGGNREQITIFGESAGSASVHSHLVAPGSRHLFKYAILQSGSMLNTWSCLPQDSAYEKSLLLAAKLGCFKAREAVSEVIECLQKKPASAIDAAVASIKVRVMEFPFVPVCQDTEFFTKHVHTAIQQGDFKSTSILVGVMKDEGSFWLPYILPQYFDNKSQSLLSTKDFKHCISTIFQGYFPKLIQQSIAYQYGNLEQCDTSLKAHLRNATNHVLGDYIFACDVIRTAKTHYQVTKQNVYLYEIQKRISNNPWPKWMGAMHGYEIGYMFGRPLALPDKFDASDASLSKDIIRFWSNFAKYGKPSSPGVWPPMTPSTKNQFLLIGEKETYVAENLKEETCQFWSAIKPYQKTDSKETHLKNFGNMLKRIHIKKAVWG